MAEALEGIRIPELPIARLFGSNSILVIYNPDLDKTFQIKASDLGLHYRNQDNGTMEEWFEVQFQSQNQNADGNTGIILRGLQGGGFDIAMRNRWDAIAGTKKLQVCNDFTGTNSDVWEDFGGTGGVYNLQSPTTTTVGLLPSGTDIAGLTWQEIIQYMTTGTGPEPAGPTNGTVNDTANTFTFTFADL